MYEYFCSEIIKDKIKVCLSAVPALYNICCQHIQYVLVYCCWQGKNPCCHLQLKIIIFPSFTISPTIFSDTIFILFFHTLFLIFPYYFFPAIFYRSPATFSFSLPLGGGESWLTKWELKSPHSDQLIYLIRREQQHCW